MKVFVFAFFILCLGCLIIESVNLNCVDSEKYWYVLGEVNFCEAENQANLITDRLDRHVDKIIGLSENSNIKGVSIYDSDCFYFPLGLEKLFPNLEGIEIYESKLKEIRREDFKEYKNIRELSLSNNEIQFLEPNLFEFVLKLEGIWLDSNKIAHIDANVFNNFVANLRWLLLSENVCRFEDADNDRSKVYDRIAEIQIGSCKDESLLPITTTSSTTTTIAIPATTTTPAPPSVSPVQFDTLKKLIENLQVSLEQEVKALKDKLEASETKLEARFAVVKAQNQKCCAGVNYEAKFECTSNTHNFYTKI